MILDINLQVTFDDGNDPCFLMTFEYLAIYLIHLYLLGTFDAKQGLTKTPIP